MQSQIFKSTTSLSRNSKEDVVNIMHKSDCDRLYIMLSKADTRPSNQFNLLSLKRTLSNCDVPVKRVILGGKWVLYWWDDLTRTQVFERAGYVIINWYESIYGTTREYSFKVDNSTELIYKMIRCNLLKFKGDQILKGGSNE